MKLLVFFACTSYVLLPNSAIAQIIPNSNSEPSTLQVNSQGQLIIDGGAIRGVNLFHSFQEFNVEAGQRVYFANPTSIQNIFSRVSGSNPSRIFGTLGVLGNANLFLLNPNGILFGANAQLDIRGSFVASTANQILLNDGRSLLVSDPNPPLLTISTPIGLQVNGGTIRVEGKPHQITGETIGLALNTFTYPIEASQTGLKTQKTLALVGQNIDFWGGTLAAEPGNLYLTAQSGTIFFQDRATGLALAEGPGQTGNISLKNQASLEIHQQNPGEASTISIRANDFLLTDSSLIFTRNASTGAKVNIQLDGNFTVDGVTRQSTPPAPAPPPRLRRQIRGIVLQGIGDSGTSGSLDIQAKNIRLQDSAYISLTNNGNLPGESLTLKADETLSVGRKTPLGLDYGSIIGTVSYGMGAAGDINIHANQIQIIEGGGITSVGNGLGGNGGIYITTDDLLVNGGTQTLIPPTPGSPFYTLAYTISSLFSSSVGALSTPKNVEIQANRSIQLLNGGALGTNAYSRSNGAVKIQTPSLLINGRLQASPEEIQQIKASLPVGSELQVDPFIPAAILSANGQYNSVSGQAIGLPPGFIPEGQTGDIEIQASNLVVTNGGVITVTNEGRGDAGNLRIYTQNFKVLSDSEISAQSLSGNGGNIDVNANRSIFLQNGGKILTSSLETGSGGNIRIQAPFFGAFNGNLFSTAVFGSGGTIQLNSPITIFRDSQVSVSSEQGSTFDGQIIIKETDSDFTVKRSELIPQSPQLEQTTCQERQGVLNTYLQTASPSIMPTVSGWHDPDTTTVKVIPSKDTSEIVEADQWVVSSDGKIHLIHSTATYTQASVNCR